MRVCAEWMTDFKRIRIGEGYSRLRPVDLIARSIATRAFLATELAKDFDGKTVVVTHHCPIQDVPAMVMKASWARRISTSGMTW